jgi:hypothetical protein
MIKDVIFSPADVGSVVPTAVCIPTAVYYCHLLGAIVTEVVIRGFLETSDRLTNIPANKY